MREDSQVQGGVLAPFLTLAPYESGMSISRYSQLLSRPRLWSTSSDQQQAGCAPRTLVAPATVRYIK